MIDPRTCTIGHDANFLDRNGSDRDRLVDRFLSLAEAGKLKVTVAGSVRREIEHPHTPREVRDVALPHTFAHQAGLNASQHISRIRVRAILRGDARAGKHDADAGHLSETAETGCAYFITHDGRMLRKRDDLHASLPPTFRIVTLAEFLAIVDRFERDPPR